MKKCLHANSARPSEDRLTTVQFHPSAQVVMTAGLDQSISLFQVQPVLGCHVMLSCHFSLKEDLLLQLNYQVEV